MKEILCYFWIFVLTSYLGFIIETIWCLFRNKRIESRKGVIYEPMIPIYGISGMLIMLIVNFFKLTKWYEIFIIGFFISSVVEFLSSFLQEKIFATKSWDYSKFPLNLNGRINVIYSILFGLVSLLLYKCLLLPFFNFFMNIKINSIIIMVSIVMFLFMLYDFIISSIAVYRMKERKRNIVRDNKFWNYVDNKYNDEYLKKVYANMVDIH